MKNRSLAQLAASYAAASRTFENTQLGSKTDAAYARMEAIMAEVEARGAAAVTEFTALLGL